MLSQPVWSENVKADIEEVLECFSTEIKWCQSVIIIKDLRDNDCSIATYNKIQLNDTNHVVCEVLDHNFQNQSKKKEEV